MITGFFNHQLLAWLTLYYCLSPSQTRGIYLKSNHETTRSIYTSFKTRDGATSESERAYGETQELRDKKDVWKRRRVFGEEEMGKAKWLKLKLQ